MATEAENEQSKVAKIVRIRKNFIGRSFVVWQIFILTFIFFYLLRNMQLVVVFKRNFHLYSA